MADGKKVYGLILSKKGQQSKEKNKPVNKTFNVFGDDSDSDGDNVPKAQTSLQSGSLKMKKQAQIDIAKTLQEDPSVYQYDEIYEDMQSSKPETKQREKQLQAKDNKPRYITGLLKAAEVKKKEEERRKERKVQKEREAEGAKYADKESFVTSAYKKKMLEMQEEEEKEKREAALEALTDVTKQKDMSGFYRYLYRETAGTEIKTEQDVKTEVKEEPDSTVKDEQEARRNRDEKSKLEESIKQEPASPKSGDDQHSSSSGSSPSPDRNKSPGSPVAQPTTGFAKRSRQTVASNYRKQRSSSSDDEEKDNRSKTGKGRKSSPRSRSKDRTRRQNRSRSKSVDKKRKRLSRSRSRSAEPQKKHRRSVERDDTSLKSSRESGFKSNSSKGKEKNRNREEELGRKDRERTSSSRSGKISVEDVDEAAVENSSVITDRLRDMRESTNVSENKENVAKKSEKPTDPKLRFPHHNSPKDIAEARKRYLQRKLERERQGLA